jgi:hypothetical protein
MQRDICVDAYKLLTALASFFFRLHPTRVFSEVFQGQSRGPSRKQNSILKRGKETVPFALFRQLLLCLDGPLRLFCEILDCPWKTSENTRVG